MKEIFKIIIFCFLIYSPSFSQEYRCDWNVVATGGVQMSGNYSCSSTCGQTAIGWVNRTNNLLGHIGFWYSDIFVGIKERKKFSDIDKNIIETKLYSISPNPFFKKVKIQYSLKNDEHVKIEICNLSGRVIKRVLNSIQKKGRHSIFWDGKDDSGKNLPNGVYILRFVAGNYKCNAKILLMR